MRVSRIKIDTKLNEWHHLTPLSDLHLDAYSCDRRAFKSLVKERNEIENHRWISIGDLGDWILPKDNKRYHPSTPQSFLNGCDNTINKVLDDQELMLKDVNFDLIGLGNHETSVMSHHAVDVIDLLCKRLGTSYGGYSGYLQYEMNLGTRSAGCFTYLYHHGKWGGKVSKGLPGLRHWASYFEGWDVVLAGHNHFAVMDREIKTYPAQRLGETRTRNVSYVFCGTHNKGYVNRPDGMPPYEEIAGMSPTAICSPMVSWRVVQSVNKSTGNNQKSIEHKVTL